MLPPTMPPITSAPKTNRSNWVTSMVEKTDVYPTESNHSQSVKTPANTKNKMTIAIRVIATGTRSRGRRGKRIARPAPGFRKVKAHP